MKGDSPFIVYRFEHERKHLYYLPPDFADLEQPIPIYLVGTRGTGKTTLLKALNWKERRSNISLGSQLSGDPFQKRYIGVYLRLPQVQLSLLTHWLRSTEELLRAQFMALYLDLLWVEEAAGAVADLLADGTIGTSPSDEHDCILSISESWAGSSTPPLPSGFRTAKDLFVAARRARRRLEDQAQADASPADVAKGVALGQLGEFGRVVGKALGALCDRSEPEGQERQWYFKICMDESECLDDFQQSVVNSMVRLSEWPTFFLLSYVHLPRDRTETLIPNLTLQKADHRFFKLDEMDDVTFRELADGVATVRVRAELQDQAVTFDTRRLLGRLDLDRILESILRESERVEARELLNAAEEWAHQIRSAAGTDVEAGDARSRPIIETYLMEKLGPAPPEAAESRWERRRYESQELRKKSVAAYLSVCRDLGVQVRYASAEMVLQMSDKSIRDFLSMIDTIYRTTRKMLRTFISEEVPFKDQVSSLRRASEEKRQSLRSSGVSLPNETGRLVDALAQLTADAQSRSSDHRHLRSTERGIFELARAEIERKGLVELYDRIRDAALAGFLKMTSDDESGLRFRVHTSLAAAYGFSYRGAYYPCPVRAAELEELRKEKDSSALSALIARIGGRLAGEQESANPSLFPRQTR